MLALYCPDDRQLDGMQATLPTTEATIATRDWVTFRRATTDAECSVVAIEWLHDHLKFTRLLAFNTRCPLHPIVLITRKDADNARHLKDLSVEEVVWPGEVQRGLWPAVQRARVRNTLRTLAHLFFKAEHLSPDLRQALAHACWSENPIPSITMLAHVVRCDRRTLWRHWSQGTDSAPALRLEDVLRWLLLLRAAGRKTPDRSWSAVAGDLNVHEHTIARLARRLAGRSLSELSATDVPALAARFRRQVLDPPTGDGGNDLGT